MLQWLARRRCFDGKTYCRGSVFVLKRFRARGSAGGEEAELELQRVAVKAVLDEASSNPCHVELPPSLFSLFLFRAPRKQSIRKNKKGAA